MRGKRLVGSLAEDCSDPTENETQPISITKPIFDINEHVKPYGPPSESVNCLFEDFYLEDEDDYWKDGEEEIHLISSPNPRLIFVDVVVKDTKIRALVDCGATCSFVDPETSVLLQKLKFASS